MTEITTMLQDYYNALILVKAGLLSKEQLEAAASLEKRNNMSLRFLLTKFHSLTNHHFQIASEARRAIAGGRLDIQTIIESVKLACCKEIEFTVALARLAYAPGMNAQETRLQWLLKNNNYIDDNRMETITMQSAKLGISIARMLELDGRIDSRIVAAAMVTVDESLAKHMTYNDLQNAFLARLKQIKHAAAYQTQPAQTSFAAPSQFHQYQGFQNVAPGVFALVSYLFSKLGN